MLRENLYLSGAGEKGTITDLFVYFPKVNIPRKWKSRINLSWVCTSGGEYLVPLGHLWLYHLCSFWVSCNGLSCPLIVGHVFLLVCTACNFLLDFCHWEFSLAGCWLFPYLITILQLCSETWFCNLETFWSFVCWGLSLVSWDQSSI